MEDLPKDHKIAGPPNGVLASTDCKSSGWERVSVRDLHYQQAH